MKSFVSRLLIILGSFLMLLSLGFYLQRINPSRLSFASDVTSSPIQTALTPVRIIIPSLTLRLPIIITSLDGKIYPTTDRGVSYVSSTPIPGNTGNSVLYGHNWESILGRLTKVKVGDGIVIVFSNGEKREFLIEKIAEVAPTQISVLEQTDDKRITLYTCSGFFDEKRFVVVAKLI